MKTIGILLCLMGLSRAQFTVVSTSIDPAFAMPLKKTDTVVQSGSDARNRFITHRVVRVQGAQPHKGTILLLPSLLTQFAEYTINEDGDAMQSLAATLALAGFDVWGYSPRVSTLGFHGCSSGAVDCSIVSTWGMDAYLDDIAYVRGQIALAHPGENPAVGGLSLGGMLGIAAVNAHPGDYAGLLMWESMLYSASPATTTLDQGNCAAWESLLAAGVYYNESIQDAALLAVNTGEQAAVQLFGTQSPAFGAPLFVVDVSNLTHTAFQYTSFPRLKAMVYADHSVESARIFRDYLCSLAGERTYASNLGAFTGPILALGGGQSFGPYMSDNLALFGSTSKNFYLIEQFGHADAYLSANHATYVEDVILDWLNSTVF